MISGSALVLRLTWMKWISTPSISVMNCGSAFSLASALRQSYPSPSSARAPEAPPTAHPASGRGRAPCWASASRDAPAQVGKLLVRNLDAEGADLKGGLDGRAHSDSVVVDRGAGRDLLSARGTSPTVLLSIGPRQQPIARPRSLAPTRELIRLTGANLPGVNSGCRGTTRAPRGTRCSRGRT